MTMHRRLIGFFVLALLTAPAAMTFAAAPPPAPLIEHQTKAPAQAYAAREIASAPRVEKFQGGGTAVYIGGSTVVIVLLVVLIVLLI